MILQTPLLFDGAMGTYYASLHGDDMPCELAALRHPERIAAIHREYLRAGARAITTDTFRAETRALGIGFDEVLRIIDAAWGIACLAAGQDADVWAGFGPPSVQPEDEAEAGGQAHGTDALEPETEMLRKADRFLDLGARHFVFETFDDDAWLWRTCSHIKSVRPDAVILVSFAVSPDGTTRSGRSGADLAFAAAASPVVDILGFNCVSGPTHLLGFIRSLTGKGPLGKPLAIMPNAGYPSLTEGRTFYRNNPDYFAETLASAAQPGIAALGGCCGTTPAHIAALAARLAVRSALTAPAPVTQLPLPQTQAAPAPVTQLPLPQTLTAPAPVTQLPLPQTLTAPAPVTQLPLPQILTAPAPLPVRNRFWERLTAGYPVLLAELDPPATADPSIIAAHAGAYRDAGADIVTIADNPLGWARADVAVTAARVHRECRVDAMPHLTCRDRNLSAIRSQLLALHIEGIRNVLVVTGDPVPADLAADTRGVFNLNSAQLMAYVRNLRDSLFGGDGFRVGGALNIGAASFDAELERAQRKIQHGADFFITQPIFGQEGLQRLAQARQTLDTRLIAGILPVVGYRNAMFLNNEVHGIHIPDDIVHAYEGLPPDRAAELGVRFALDTLRAAAGFVDGFHLVTPLKKTGVVAEILRRCRTEIFQKGSQST